MRRVEGRYDRTIFQEIKLHSEDVGDWSYMTFAAHRPQLLPERTKAQ